MKNMKPNTTLHNLKCIIPPFTSLTRLLMTMAILNCSLVKVKVGDKLLHSLVLLVLCIGTTVYQI